MLQGKKNADANVRAVLRHCGGEIRWIRWRKNRTVSMTARCASGGDILRVCSGEVSHLNYLPEPENSPRIGVKKLLPTRIRLRQDRDNL